MILKTCIENLISEVASDATLDFAFNWICKKREFAGSNNSIWHVRYHWEKLKNELRASLVNNTYHLSPLKRYKIAGQNFDSWDALDGVVLKALEIILSRYLYDKIPLSCTHIKGHGGLKQTINKTQESLPDYKFVFKSDVESYYASINHSVLLRQLKTVINDPIVLRLLGEYCQRLIWIKGDYESILRGIPLGCPLSPLMSAWYLREMDLAMQRQRQVYYARFMDDWVVLAKTRNHLRKAIKTIEKILGSLGLQKHPDKTFIGWINKGFSFLGYELSPSGVLAAPKTLDKCAKRVKSLLQSGASPRRIQEYLKRWVRWVKSGVTTFVRLPFVIESQWVHTWGVRWDPLGIKPR